MTPDAAFRDARDVLLRHATDLAAARAAFRWPALEYFNWVDHWFQPYARGNRRDALRVVTDAGTTALTFDELELRSRSVARYLRDAGVERGDRMLLMLTNVAPLWETVLAAIRLGVVLIPATAQLTPADLDDRIERGGVRHIVTDADGAAKLRDPERLRVRLSTVDVDKFARFDDARAAEPKIDEVRTRADEALLLYFTSGTTAKPKLVLHTHASYPIGHLSTMYWVGLRENDVHQNISSPGWAKHAWSSLFAPWNAGATIVAHDQPRFSARRALEVLREQNVSTLCAPPTVWRMMILEDLGPRPPALREIVGAGEPLNPEVIDRVERAWGITMRDGFGQTETTAVIGNAPGQQVKPGSMGTPLPGYDATIVDAAGNPAAEGEVAIRIAPSRPLGLMQGYLDDPERTAAVMAGGLYRTGDEARIDDEGYVHFVGRGDDVFKSSDYRISPFELESVLVEHELVAEAAIVPSPDALRLAVPKAFVVLRPGTPETEATARSIFAFVRERLAPYKRIRRLEFAALPKTISGKIRRVELRNMERDRRAREERGPLEFWSDELER
ncbi:MAG TPA: AMP-binding protein [Kofleriaceae bacterium]|nr:AMP-binding protein [Kofleriaceae bacterium]